MKLQTIKKEPGALLNGEALGIITFNIWTDGLYGSIHDLKDEVINTIRRNSHGNNTTTRILDVLVDSPIVGEYKVMRQDGKNYYQFAVCAVEAIPIARSYGRNILSSIKRSVTVGGNYGMCVADNVGFFGYVGELSSANEEEFIYFGKNAAEVTKVGNLAVENTLENLIYGYETVHDNDKQYNNGTQVKINLVQYASLEQAFKEKTKATISFSQISPVSGPYIFKRLSCKDYSGIYRYELTYPNKIKVDTFDGRLVFYDGEKAYNTMKPYISSLNDSIKIIDIIQYATNKDLYYQPIKRVSVDIHQAKKITFNFVQREYLPSTLTNREVSAAPYRVNGNIPIAHKTRRYNKVINLRIDPDSIFTGQLIIPVDDTSVDPCGILTAIHLCNAALSHSGDFMTLVENYKNCIIKQVANTEADDDILSTWFAHCNNTSSNEDKHIVRTYEMMKERLIKEYKELEVYVSHYDFSKCTPIPTIKMDKKLTDNYYKTLQLEAFNNIINSVNNKRIEEFRSVKPYVTVMMEYHNLTLQNKYPISKFYNASKNEIDLNYIELRGAVINDKIKNRR